MEGVAGEDDTSGEGYMLPREAIGIALAGPTLVFGPDNGGEMSKALDQGNAALTDCRMLLRQLLITLIQRSRLVQDRVGYPNLPNVVQ